MSAEGKLKQKRVSLLRRSLPFVISFALIAILASYAPLHKIGQSFKEFDSGYLSLLVLLSLLYYGLKALRFWYLLQAMEIKKPLGLVAVSYMSAQPVSLLPGGEIYRSQSLRRYTGVPVKESIAQFTMQGFLEGLAMVSLAVISALALHTLRTPMLILSAILLIIMIAFSKGYVTSLGRLINRLPFVNVATETYEKLDARQRAVLSWQWLPFLYGLSLLIELTGATIAYISVLGVGGHIDAYQAILLYVIPVIVGFVSFLPGGLGLSEQSAVGILLLSDIAAADAVAATIIMRLTIVGLGLVYGVLMGLYGHRYILPKTLTKSA